MKIFNKILKDYFENIDIKLPNKDIEIKKIFMDSKKVEKNSLFIAINNGNNYIDEALKNGAELVISDRECGLNNQKVIKVKNSIVFLQDLAKLYRKNLKIKIVAVTGSEGKTTTKDIIHGVLSRKYITKKTLGNYNNHIGLPYTILQLKEEDEICILEMGMSSLGEIDLLGSIGAPDYAVITNIGDSHLEYLKNRDNVFKAKTEILNHVPKNNVIVYGDDEYLKNIEAIKIGANENNDYKITDQKIEFEGSHFQLNNEKYFVPLNGEHNIINSSFAIVIGKLFGLSYSEISENLKSIEITSMRFEKIEKNGILYINDAYNASPISIAVAVKTFSKLPINKEKVLVLADALELGENEIKYHKNIIQNALRYDFKKIFIYGNLMKIASESIYDSRLQYFESKSTIKAELEKMKNIVVLLKGSRGMKLEEIIN